MDIPRKAGAAVAKALGVFAGWPGRGGELHALEFWLTGAVRRLLKQGG